MGCSQILSVRISGLEVDLLLIVLVHMSLNSVFSDPLCTYVGSRGEFRFNLIGSHEFEWGVLRFSL